MNDEFSVYLEARSPGGVAMIDDADAGDRLMDLLEEYGGVIAGAMAGDTSWAATVSVDADDATGALLVAADPTARVG